MREHTPKQLHEQLYMIDGFDLYQPERTGIYVLRIKEAVTLIETGPSISVPHVLKGLACLDIDSADVRYIIVTHIHLDHAGGAGLLMKSCPQAEIIVHERGQKHLIDPSRLIMGARQVYQDAFDDLFDPVLPVEANRVLVKGEGDVLRLGAERKLYFIDTPGHAKHHFSIYDNVSKGVFTGDTAGVRYVDGLGEGRDFFLPSTSPNQFDPEAMIASIERLRSFSPQRLFFGHFGMSDEVDKALDEVTYWIPRFVEAGVEALQAGEGAAGIERRLLQSIASYVREFGVEKESPLFQTLTLDLPICALGIKDYIDKKARKEG
ncbi:MBL fold metallo-hydrolase [Mechercharimyces sp. CAU 1602]|uniref:MBL fold metallo-hydrolase n=1 Tax=Mechercharimyces sp. CAU 1602 TaxID=2973933 RepID=UPI0021638391|nr:MBL fold metallo-hydrolase [Mechercharimyces sp. CAU 1602]MCS1351796.1 MBL fold metallo-hydrolase [Mechercharimyces sp. CAU 1602]